jgi:hypothetical protein
MTTKNQANDASLGAAYSPPDVQEERRELDRRAEDRKHTRELVVQLLKFPVLVLAIFLGLLGANKILGMQFGTVMSIGTDGVRFAERSDELSGEVVKLRTQLDQALYRLEVVEKQRAPAAGAGTGEARSAARRHEEQQFDKLQQVTTVAALSKSVSGKDPKALTSGREGYIWIGNYDPNGGWSRAKIATEKGSALPHPKAIGVGDEFIVGGNMVLRDGAPTNDDSYFTSRSSIGVVPKGTRVIVVEEPRAYDRSYAVQCWMKIRIAD